MRRQRIITFFVGIRKIDKSLVDGSFIACGGIFRTDMVRTRVEDVLYMNAIIASRFTIYRSEIYFCFCAGKTIGRKFLAIHRQVNRRIYTAKAFAYIRGLAVKQKASCHR